MVHLLYFQISFSHHIGINLNNSKNIGEFFCKSKLMPNEFQSRLIARKCAISVYRLNASQAESKSVYLHTGQTQTHATAHTHAHTLAHVRLRKRRLVSDARFYRPLIDGNGKPDTKNISIRHNETTNCLLPLRRSMSQ